MQIKVESVLEKKTKKWPDREERMQKQTNFINVIRLQEGMFENNSFERLDLLEEDFLVIIKKGRGKFSSLNEFQQLALNHPLIEYNKQSSDRIPTEFSAQSGCLRKSRPLSPQVIF